MYGINPGGMYPPSMPQINPSPFQYPAPSTFGMQNLMQNQSTQQQPQQTGPDWIRVSTAAQVEQVSVQPGSKAWVMVENMPVFALRVADNMGLVTTDYYRFEKIDAVAATGANNGNLNPGNGITMEEVETLINERLNAFADSFKPLQREKKGDSAE